MCDGGITILNWWYENDKVNDDKFNNTDEYEYV